MVFRSRFLFFLSLLPACFQSLSFGPNIKLLYHFYFLCFQSISLFFCFLSIFLLSLSFARNLFSSIFFLLIFCSQSLSFAFNLLSFFLFILLSISFFCFQFIVFLSISFALNLFLLLSIYCLSFYFFCSQSLSSFTSFLLSVFSFFSLSLTVIFPPHSNISLSHAHTSFSPVTIGSNPPKTQLNSLSNSFPPPLALSFSQQSTAALQPRVSLPLS